MDLWFYPKQIKLSTILVESSLQVLRVSSCLHKWIQLMSDSGDHNLSHDYINPVKSAGDISVRIVGGKVKKRSAHYCENSKRVWVFKLLITSYSVIESKHVTIFVLHRCNYSNLYWIKRALIQWQACCTLDECCDLKHLQ